MNEEKDTVQTNMRKLLKRKHGSSKVDQNIYTQTAGNACQFECRQFVVGKLVHRNQKCMHTIQIKTPKMQ